MNQMKIGDKILIVALLILAIGLFFYQFSKPEGVGKQVVVEVNGEIIKTFSLPQAEPIQYKVEIDEDDYNLLEVEGSRVRVLEATCQEQVDVLQGWIDKPGQALICLPHKLIVKIEGEENVDDEIDVRTF
ncbi:MAG: NusG domain II-containing protein [Halanaerobiales bacterium]|nr:NusG domain II-containing protein [Halanaerobiales bacterium]